MTEAQDHDHDHVEEIRGSEIGDILTENIPTPEDELEATAEEMLEQAINEKIVRLAARRRDHPQAASDRRGGGIREMFSAAHRRDERLL